MGAVSCSTLQDRLAATRQAYSSSGASKAPGLAAPLESSNNMISSLRIRTSTPSSASAQPVLRPQLSSQYRSKVKSAGPARPTTHVPQQALLQEDAASSGGAPGSASSSPGAQSLEGAHALPPCRLCRPDCHAQVSSWKHCKMCA